MTSQAHAVAVEFFGLPRQRAGVRELHVAATTVRGALAEIVRACPRLAGIVTADGRLSPHYLLSLDGMAFVNDLDSPLDAGARLLVLAADAGG